jgi:hypothetical protein
VAATHMRYGCIRLSNAFCSSSAFNVALEL